MKNLVLYGAGRNAANEAENARRLGYSPVCFCDADPIKHGTVYLGLPVKSLDEIKSSYDEFSMWLTVINDRCNIIDYLIRNGVEKSQILNYENYSIYRGCSFLETQLIADHDGLTFCCYSGKTLKEPPKLKWSDSIENSVDAFLAYRGKLIEQIKADGITTPCASCPAIQIRALPEKKKINFVALGFDSPCNLACCYCVHRNAAHKIDREKENQIRNFEWKKFIECLEQRGQLSENVKFSLASGELTCDPRKNDILDAIDKYHLEILTNAVLFDERIAELIARPGNVSVVSIDAGTRETYEKVKGLDAFERVFENVGKYIKRGGNVILKYIFLSENSNSKDVEGFIRNTLASGAREICVSNNIFKTEQNSEDQIQQIAYMVKLAKQNNLGVVFANDIFSREDLSRIEQYCM